MRGRRRRQKEGIEINIIKESQKKMNDRGAQEMMMNLGAAQAIQCINDVVKDVSSGQPTQAEVSAFSNCMSRRMQMMQGLQQEGPGGSSAFWVALFLTMFALSYNITSLHSSWIPCYFLLFIQGIYSLHISLVKLKLTYLQILSLSFRLHTFRNHAESWLDSPS